MAIVAAVALTFRGAKKNSRSTHSADQIRVKAADRMRIVKMPVEQESEPASPTDAAR